MSRITNHPIVKRSLRPKVTFRFQDRAIVSYEGEMIASALFAAGYRAFGHHPKDGSPQGLFCANGQCSQCMVIADGRPVKACMTPVREGMHVLPLDGLPVLPVTDTAPLFQDMQTIRIPVLILGGGPAGLSAAIELGTRGVDVLIVDDKDRLGGKLVLQTHRFFGSTEAVHAGTRGIDIGARLESQVRGLPSVDVWLDSTALAVFSDKRVGILRADVYVLVEPQILLVATGAREKSLVFPGNTLPGVYGAGAFQTLVNRDLVRAADRLFIIGGGNVGLIAGYHALQAGIEVVGLVEAMPQCGGYKVHRDKLARVGVPIYTSHTVLSANGTGAVESVTVAQIDAEFAPIAGTERSYACDTVLVAVGLDPVDEFVRAGTAYGLHTVAAGDAEEIAEASAAIFSGRIKGLEIARGLGVTDDAVPEAWQATATVLKSRPGRVLDRESIDTHLSPGDPSQARVVPVFHCSQEIPCNPCTSVCPRDLIHIDSDDMRALPRYIAEEGTGCIGCAKCVAICPGLAITLVDGRQDPTHPLVTIPLEFGDERLAVGDVVTVLAADGAPLGDVPVVEVRTVPANDRTALIRVQASTDIASRIAGVRIQQTWVASPLPAAIEPIRDQDIVCRCERVTAGEIRALIRSGVKDINEIKTRTRAGMGACGGKTCQSLILRLFRDEGVPSDQITENVPRPLFVEVPLGTFAGSRDVGTPAAMRRAPERRGDDA